MVAMPAFTPVTIPVDEPIVATEVLEELQLPAYGEKTLNMLLAPLHMDVEPVIAGGVGLIRIGNSVGQPWALVKINVSRPVKLGITTADKLVELLIDAIVALDSDHVPPVEDEETLKVVPVQYKLVEEVRVARPYTCIVSYVVSPKVT